MTPESSGWCMRLRALGRVKRLPLVPRAAMRRAHAGGLADDVGADVGATNFIVSMMPRPAETLPPGRVDVDVDVVLGVLVGEEEELRDDEVGDLVGDGPPRKMMRSLSRRE
jgi:hypothetical protein